MQLNGETVANLESYVDSNNDYQRQKVYDIFDEGGLGSEGEECE
jgi:hypothetical protein